MKGECAILPIPKKSTAWQLRTQARPCPKHTPFAVVLVPPFSHSQSESRSQAAPLEFEIQSTVKPHTITISHAPSIMPHCRFVASKNGPATNRAEHRLAPTQSGRVKVF